MIAIDTNILVYAHRRDNPWHKQSDEFLTGIAEGSALWCIPYPCLHEFYAKVTHQKIFQPPTKIEDALVQIEYWLESPSLRLIGEREDYFSYLKKLISSTKITGSSVHDLRIASICIQNGVSTLYSADRDFNRITGLKIKNPFT